MAPSKKIPLEVQASAEELLERFNREQLKETGIKYIFRFKGKYLYIDRQDYPGMRAGKMCRLEYTGNPDDWEFAIYLYSDDGYDPEEWTFEGSDLFDGTIESALHAAMEAYPP